MQFLLLTTNRFGVLSRITSVVSAFGAHIDTVSVYPLGESGSSAVCFTVPASDSLRQRLHRKLSRLVDVIEISSGLENELRVVHPKQASAASYHTEAGLS